MNKKKKYIVQNYFFCFIGLRKAKGKPPMESEKEFIENKNLDLRPSSYPDARREYVIL
jgi:hypothetical protein